MEFKNASLVIEHLLSMNIISNCDVSVGDETGDMICLKFGGSPVETNDNTLFDMASASKIIGVTCVILRFVDIGKISLFEFRTLRNH